MRRFPLYLVMLMLLLPSCSKSVSGTSAVVKPKYHHWWFNKKKDKGNKRTQVVRMRN